MNARPLSICLPSDAFGLALATPPTREAWRVAHLDGPCRFCGRFHRLAAVGGQLCVNIGKARVPREAAGNGPPNRECDARSNSTGRTHFTSEARPAAGPVAAISLGWQIGDCPSSPGQTKSEKNDAHANSTFAGTAPSAAGEVIERGGTQAAGVRDGDEVHRKGTQLCSMGTTRTVTRPTAAGTDGPVARARTRATATVQTPTAAGAINSRKTPGAKRAFK